MDRDGQLCSGRIGFAKCEFWKDLGLDRVSMRETEDIRRKVENASSVPQILVGLVNEVNHAIYRGSQSCLFDFVMGHSVLGLADEIIS